MWKTLKAARLVGLYLSLVSVSIASPYRHLLESPLPPIEADQAASETPAQASTKQWKPEASYRELLNLFAAIENLETRYAFRDQESCAAKKLSFEQIKDMVESNLRSFEVQCRPASPATVRSCNSLALSAAEAQSSLGYWLRATKSCLRSRSQLERKVLKQTDRAASLGVRSAAEAYVFDAKNSTDADVSAGVDARYRDSLRIGRRSRLVVDGTLGLGLRRGQLQSSSALSSNWLFLSPPNSMLASLELSREEGFWTPDRSDKSFRASVSPSLSYGSDFLGKDFEASLSTDFLSTEHGLYSGRDYKFQVAFSELTLGGSWFVPGASSFWGKQQNLFALLKLESLFVAPERFRYHFWLGMGEHRQSTRLTKLYPKIDISLKSLRLPGWGWGLSSAPWGPSYFESFLSFKLDHRRSWIAEMAQLAKLEWGLAWIWGQALELPVIVSFDFWRHITGTDNQSQKNSAVAFSLRPTWSIGNSWKLGFDIEVSNSIVLDRINVDPLLWSYPNDDHRSFLVGVNLMYGF